MNLKIIYRSAVIWNVVLHFLLSLMFLFLQQAIYEEKSVLNLAFFKSIVTSYWPIMSMIIISSLLVFRIKKISYLFYLISVTSVVAYSSYELWFDFSKLILLVLFIYTLVSYYLSFMLKSDLEHAFYNPGFSEKDLFDPMLMQLKVDVHDKKSNKTYVGHLTNWDEDGCFIKFVSGLPKKKKLQLTFYFRGHEFTQMGTAATQSKKNNGIGVRFVESKSRKGWAEVYKIVSDMGINLEYIK